MRNIKFLISYNGAAYHGWQIQPGLPTIEGKLTEVLTYILRHNVKVIGCSRTDAGVHAREYCFNVPTENPIPCEGLHRAVNNILPKDICVLSCEEADQNFHARYSSKSKEYIYVCNNYKNYKNHEIYNVFLNGMIFNYSKNINLEKLNKLAKLFVGRHDFSAFCKSESLKNLKKLKNLNREIYAFDVFKDNKLNFLEFNNNKQVVFRVSGNGFLHNMVRILVGTLIDANENKRGEQDIIQALKTGVRARAGITMPPCGLYLNKVFY